MKPKYFFLSAFLFTFVVLGCTEAGRKRAILELTNKTCACFQPSATFNARSSIAMVHRDTALLKKLALELKNIEEALADCSPALLASYTDLEGEAQEEFLQCMQERCPDALELLIEHR